MYEIYVCLICINEVYIIYVWYISMVYMWNMYVSSIVYFYICSLSHCTPYYRNIAATPHCHIATLQHSNNVTM